MHDGCHALDLMNWWFGKIRWAVKSNGFKEPDFDMSHGFMAGYERCPQVVFTPVDSKDYGVFEIEVITNKGQYILRHNGTQLHTRKIISGDGWGDYPVIGPTHAIQTNLTSAMCNLYENVVGFLDGKEELKCTSQDALAVWEAFNKINEGPE